MTSLGARVVLITGCDSGFGRGLVEAALAEGFEVVSACYTPDGAAAIEATGGGVATVTTVVADLATPEGVKAVVRVAKEVAGARGLYGLVNNAGRCVPGNCGGQCINQIIAARVRHCCIEHPTHWLICAQAAGRRPSRSSIR